MDYLWIFIFGTLFTLCYGVMAGFTIQVARRAGITESNIDVALGLGWPLGLGIAMAYGPLRSLGQSEDERRGARIVSAHEQREEDLRQQKHNTAMAELKAKEALALEKAVHPTYEAKEIEGRKPVPPPPKVDEYRWPAQ